MMQCLYKYEIKKLSALCKESYYEAKAVVADDTSSAMEKICAQLHLETMADLMVKLDEIVASNAKRVEVR